MVEIENNLSLITDRSEADVEYFRKLSDKVKNNIANAEEIAQYLKGTKGTYTADDLNRVGAAVELVAAALTDAGYTFIPTLKTNWSSYDLFVADDMANYLANIDGLRKTLAVLLNTPETPGAVLNYTQANDLERIIEDVYRAYQNMIAFYFCLDDLYMGEV